MLAMKPSNERRRRIYITVAVLFFLTIPIELALAFSGLSFVYQFIALLVVAIPVAALLGRWIRQANPPASRRDDTQRADS